MYVLLLNNYKIDIFFGVSLLSYQSLYVIITILQRMFTGNANKYNYDYNYYHNTPFNKKTNAKRYITNEDQDVNDDYGFFVILDHDNDPLLPQFRKINMHNTRNKYYDLEVNKNTILNSNYNTNTNSHIQSHNNHVPNETICDCIVQTPVPYKMFLKTFSVPSLMNIYGIVCNVVKWFFSE